MGTGAAGGEACQGAASRQARSREAHLIPQHMPVGRKAGASLLSASVQSSNQAPTKLQTTDQCFLHVEAQAFSGSDPTRCALPSHRRPTQTAPSLHPAPAHLHPSPAPHL